MMSDPSNHQGTTSILLASAALGAAMLVSPAVSAQTPPPATPAEPAPATPPAAAPPPAATTAPAPTEAPPAAAEPAPVAPAVVAPGTAAPAPGAPPPVEEKKPEVFTITTGFGVRFGLQFQKLREPDKVGGPSVDEIYVEPRFSGKVLDFIGWTANLAVSGNTPATVLNGPPAPPEGPPAVLEVRALDLIAQLDFMDEFHIWGGRMLTPSDRSNFSGPWFMSPWDYPGLYSVPGQGFAYIGPRGTEEAGREVGTVVWGDIAKGKFKYYLGAMDLDDAPANTPLYTGRVQAALIGAEPGFYGSSTYYGSQNILAIGAAAQYQKRFNFTYGAPPTAVTFTDDLFEFNADVLAEFNVGDSGTATLEGAYYMVDSGETAGVMPYDSAFFVVASYLLPAMGPGKLQPLFRYQAAMNDDTGPVTSDGSIIEGQVNYVMKDYFAKVSLGYAHTDMDNGIEGNAVQFGFQIQQ
jgi:hypothetical protein